MKRALWLVAVAACSSALDEPPPLSALAPHRDNGRSASELMRDADAAWAKRGHPGQAAIAQSLYLDAAAADEHRVDALVGAMRAITFRIEHEPGVAKAELAKQEVELGQWCRRRAPTDAECDYRLAIALGQQARERPSTGMDAINRMVELLHRAIAMAPRLDFGGPHRVLALILLRAPGWPVGPGDNGAGLDEARAAVELFPSAPANLLALAEALDSTGAREQALATYRKALAEATAARDAGDPEGAGWVAQAHAGLEHASGE
ncbi:MAG TPA: hypothetical protein VMJ10_18970 [Kofleriaceae bacterium]|nr:hypothetical protein [Kofleriaceae bacterium]